MMVAAHRERELTFDVDDDVVVPDVATLLPPGGSLESATHTLTNTYYDTTEGSLALLNLTLRRRTGGTDAGWQLKVPTDDDARTEIASRSRSGTVPPVLADALAGVRRGRELVPVAVLTTERRVTRLLDDAGALLLEVADDRVGADTLGVSPRTSWREVEIELGPAGDEDLLERAAELLRETGARPSPAASKLRQALPTETPSPSDPPTLADLVATYVREQCVAILHADVGMRLDRPVVHPFRVAMRRLRSVLRVFGDVVDPERARDLDTELVWLAGLLGEVRDREVLRARLAEQVAALPPEHVLGPAARRIDETLLAEIAHHLEQVTAAMHGARYDRLLASVATWLTDPPLTAEAAQAGPVDAYLKRARRTLTRRLRRAGGDVEALHGARKAAKRLRYATELSAPVAGAAADRSADAAKKLQTLLGEHQDAVVSAQLLRRMGAAAGTADGENGFTYGILLAQEWTRAERIRRKLRKRYG